MGSTDQEIEPRKGMTSSRSLFPRPMQAEWDRLYYSLALKGRGSPIQAPDMQLNYPIERRIKGYSIGDVVLFDSRGFVDFVFNTCVPANSPLNGLPEDIPDGFSPLVPPLDPANIHDDAPFKGHTVMDGKSVRKFQIHGHAPGSIFDAVAEEMAILTIPDGVKSQDVIDVSCFRKYVAENAIGWYKFVNEVGGRRATNGDLRVVVGLDHCSSWSRVTTSSVIVAVPGDGKAIPRSFSRFNAGVSGGGQGVLEPMEGRELLQGGAVYQNQSVFLRTLNISVCDDIWCKIAEEYRPHIELYRHPSTPEIPFKWDSNFIEMHPANGINALLLKAKPCAKYAITQDSDWISVLKPDDLALPSASEFLSRILKVYNVCEEDDVVFLEYKPESRFPSGNPVLLKWARLAMCQGRMKVQTGIMQNLDCESLSPQRVSFPLKVGEKVARLYTGPTHHRQFQADDAPMEWFKSHIEEIVEIYGADHNITSEDLVLITGTLDAQDYALFVSDCHREGSVSFEVDATPQVGQPWGAFLPTNDGQFTSKVSRHGGPWETVLVSCLRVESTNAVVQLR